MAPSVPPVLRGLLWPVGNLVTMAAMPATPVKGHGATGDVPASTHFSGKPVADSLLDHVGVQLSTLPKLALAALVWAQLSGPAGAWSASAAALEPAWVARIFLRDMLLTWLIAGGWEFIVCVGGRRASCARARCVGGGARRAPARARARTHPSRAHRAAR